MKTSSPLLAAAFAMIALGTLPAATLDFTPNGLQTGTLQGAYFQEVSDNNAAGSGVIDSFLRTQSPAGGGPEVGYNTDARPVQFDEKNDATHTHTIRLGDLKTVTISGVDYYRFILDINEPNNRDSLLSITQLQVFASSAGDLGATGKQYDTATRSFGSLATEVYDLSAGDPSTILLDDTNSGSGRYDLFFNVPVSAFAGLPASTYVYLFHRMGDPIGGDDTYADHGGFEEWAALTGPSTPTPPPTPTPAPGISLVKTGTFYPAVAATSVGSNLFPFGNAFHALIFGDFSAVSGDTDGRLAVAGNLTISGGYSVGTPVKGRSIPVASNGAVDRLIVDGDFNDGDWGVNGNIVIRGTRTGPTRWPTHGNQIRQVAQITFNEEGNVPDDASGITFPGLRAMMRARSAALGTCADRGVVTKNLALPYRADLVGSDPELNVFNVTAEEWSRSSSSINIDAPAGSTVLVNIHGPAVAIANCGMHLTGVDLEHIVYNYVDATDLRTTNFAHLGSVLAPNAAATFVAGSIDGRAVIGGPVAASNGFEFHNFHFTGTVQLPVAGRPPVILYNFTVTNSGELPLQNVIVTDPMVAVNGGPITLDVGQSDSTTFTAEYFPTDAEIASGTLSNTATVTATTTDGRTVGDTSTHVLTFPGAGGSGSSGGSSSGGSGSAPSPTPHPTPTPGVAFTVTGPTLRVTSSSSAIVSGAVSGASRVAIVQGNTARFLPSRGTSINVRSLDARFRFRVTGLVPGRNVVRLTGTAANGDTASVTITIIKR